MATPTFAPADEPVAPASSTKRLTQIGDRIFAGICRSAALLIIVLSVMLLGMLVWKSMRGMSTVGVSFLTSSVWDPVDADNHRKFGALAFVYGTVATSLIAMAIAVPLGVGTAAFLSEIASGWLRRIASFLVEMLAAIPSVVYGFWGMVVLAPLLGK